MKFDKIKLNEELKKYAESREYKKIVEILKESRRANLDEYRMFMGETVNKVNDPFNNEIDKTLRNIPLEKLFTIAGDEELPIEKKINWFQDWISISKESAKDIFYEVILPDANNKSVLATFINMYCGQVFQTQVFKNDEFKDEIIKLEKIIDDQIDNMDKKRYSINILIKSSIKIKEYELAEKLLKKYHRVVQDEPELWYLTVKHTGNKEFFEQAIKQLNGDNKIKALLYYNKLID